MNPGIISSGRRSGPTRRRATSRAGGAARRPRRASRRIAARPCGPDRPDPERPADDQQQRTSAARRSAGRRRSHEDLERGQRTEQERHAAKARNRSGIARRSAGRSSALDGHAGRPAGGRRPTSSISRWICGWAPRNSSARPRRAQAPREQREVDHQRGVGEHESREVDNDVRLSPERRGAPAAGAPVWTGPRPRGSAAWAACHRSRRSRQPSDQRSGHARSFGRRSL